MTSSHEMQSTSNPNDVTIDIPMTKISSRTGSNGLRKPTMSPSTHNPAEFPSGNEKHAHFQSGPGGRRKKMEERGRANSIGEDGSVTTLGRIYSRIYHFSFLTRYFVYVAPLAFVIAIPIVAGATVAQKATIGGVRLIWFFSWIEVLWTSLWVSKIVAKCLPYIFQFLCGVVSSGTRKYSLIITALEIPLSLVGWAVTALTTFVPLMTLNPDQRRLHETSLKPWESIVKNILFAALISSGILLSEKLLIQLVSISYHRKQFDDRIKESKRNIHLISLLYDASRHLFPAYCPEFAEEDYLIHDLLDIGPSRGASRPARSGAATPMRLIQNVGRIGDKVTAAFGNVAHEITGKQVFNPTSAHSVVVEALERKVSYEALAKRIWMSFVIEGRDALYHEDIVDVLGEERSTEADEAFACLDVDGNGDISLDEMMLRMGEFSRERRSIANSMHDVDQAINVLDNVLVTVVFLAVVFVFVAFLNKSLTTTLATTGTALLSLSFVFSTSAQEILGSVIFIFVKHPFDVGDRVDILDKRLVVERISLLYTLFRGVTDQKKTQVANIVLNTTWIDNISRSKAMREQIKLYISFDTTFEDIELLKKEMQNFVLDKENSRDFQPDIDIEVTDLAEMDKLELTVEIRHKSNWALESVRAARRSKFMCALVLALRKVPIYGPGGSGAPAGDPANPTYSVAISDEQATLNKKEYADDLDKKRLIPKNAEGNSSSTNDSSTLGRTSSIEHARNTESDAAVLDQMNPRKAAVQRSASRSKQDLDRIPTRESDVEEVRNILRRQSTRGMRKAHQHHPLSPVSGSRYQAHPHITPIAEIPPPAPAADLAAPTPSAASQPYYVPRPPAPPPLQMPERWYEEPGNPMASRNLPIEQSTSAPARPGTAGSRGGPVMPGNAFSQQQYQLSGNGLQEDYDDVPSVPPRRPVPGMPEMKGALMGGNHGPDPP